MLSRLQTEVHSVGSQPVQDGSGTISAIELFKFLEGGEKLAASSCLETVLCGLTRLG